MGPGLNATDNRSTKREKIAKRCKVKKYVSISENN